MRDTEFHLTLRRLWYAVDRRLSRETYKSFAFYRCRNKACDLFGKSIRKDQIEGDFEKLLGSVQPSRGAFADGKGYVRALLGYA